MMEPSSRMALRVLYLNPFSQEVSGSDESLLDLLRVVVRRKRIILIGCTFAALVSAAYSLSMPNVYSATARVLPPQKEVGGGVSALLGQMGGLAGLAGGALGGSADLYMGILKSRSVADAVIKRLDLQTKFKTKTIDETRSRLAGVVKPQAGKDGIITITAENRDPKLAAALANVMVEELGNKSVQLNLTKAGNERVFLEKRLDVVKQDLANAEEALKSFQEKNKMFKVDTQAAASIEGIAKLKAEIVSKEVQLASLKSFQTDETPEVKLLQASLAKLRSQQGALSGNGVSDVFPSVGNVPNLGLEYARRMRELKTQEAIFEQLKKQHVNLGVSNLQMPVLPVLDCIKVANHDVGRRIGGGHNHLFKAISPSLECRISDGNVFQISIGHTGYRFLIGIGIGCVLETDSEG